MSEAKEPKQHSLKVRKGFSLNGKNYKKGDVFLSYITGWFVKDGIEVAELQPDGDAKANGVPAEFFCFAEAE
jgi:hypothetical protein